MREPDGGYLATDGGSLHWAVAGAGPAVLAIHGGSADMRMWEGLVPALADSYRVIRYDLRGLGRSSRPVARYRMADDAAALLDHLGETRAALVGFSTGGAIAVDFAVRYPQRIAALVTVGSIIPLVAPPEGLAAARAELMGLLAAREQARQRGDLAAAVDADLDVWAAAHQGAARSQLHEWGMANPYFHFGMGEHEELGPVEDSMLAEITAPTLVTVGDRDTQLSRMSAEHMVATISAARLRVFPGADHFVNTAQPAEFNMAVRAFLDETYHAPAGRSGTNLHPE